MTCDPKDNQKIDAVVLQVSNPTKNGRLTAAKLQRRSHWKEKELAWENRSIVSASTLQELISYLKRLCLVLISLIFEDKDRRGERSLAEGKMAEEPESYKLQKSEGK